MTEHNNRKDDRRKRFHIPSWVIILAVVISITVISAVVSILTAPEPTIMVPGPQPLVDTII